MIKHSLIRTVNDHTIRSKADIIRYINKVRSKGVTHVTISLQNQPSQNYSTMPQLHFEQLRHINQMHIALR